jgi:hypothetical protein
MFKSDRKKRRKSRSKRCRTRLGKKYSKSQVRSSCRRILGKKRRSKRKIMDGARILGEGDNGLLNIEQKQQFRNIFTDFTTIIHFAYIELKKFRPIRELRTQPTGGADEIEFYGGNIEIKQHLNDSYQIVKINSQEPVIPNIFGIGRVKKYELLLPSGAGAV